MVVSRVAMAMYQRLCSAESEKVDKVKVEDELLRLMEQVEKLQGEAKTLAAQADAEQQKLASMREQITGKLAELKVEIDQLKPARDSAAAGIPPKTLEIFEKLCKRFDGEAMAAIEKPDRRVEEYNCGACNMWMAADIYNRLHSRDDAVFCPSCRRFLFIPDDLPPEEAINQKKKPKKSETENVSDETASRSAQ